jgi:hypothetical protein
MWLAALLLVVSVAWLVRSWVQRDERDDGEGVVFSMLPEAAQREIRKKQKLRERHDNGKVIRRGASGTSALPPGQYKANSWIILDLGFDLPDDKYRDPSSAEYRIVVTGLQGGDKTLSLADLVCR